MIQGASPFFQQTSDFIAKTFKGELRLSDADLVPGQSGIVFTPGFDKDAELKVTLKEIPEPQALKAPQEQEKKKKTGANFV